MIPHLSTHHCKSEKETHDTPHVFVGQKFQIVATNVKDESNLNLKQDRFKIGFKIAVRTGL